MQRTLPGLDVLDAGDAHAMLEILRAGRVGLLTNQTGRTLNGTPALAVLRDLNTPVTALFSPEHGLAGTREGTVASGSTEDGLPIHSLYGATRRPTEEMLDAIDVLVCDLQDVGARFYTYASTLAYAMEECAQYAKAVVVLDRPNPLGGEIIEGPHLQDECRSFVGHLRVPVRHGLSLGELALLHREDEGLILALHIVRVAGWKRSQRWPETELPWRRPSPNLPDYNSAAWYAGICLLEFSGISVGRGTETPFQIIGAPWFAPQAVLQAMREWPHELRERFSAESIEFTPTHGEHAAVKCCGMRFEVAEGGMQSLDFVVSLGLSLLSTLHHTHPHEFNEEKMRAALPLLGSPAVLQTLIDHDIEGALKLSHADAAAFRARRAPVLLYD